MRVLILGATGLVGHSLWRGWRGRSGWEVSGTSRARVFPGIEPLDICDPDARKQLLSRMRPEAVVLSASNPNVDFCEAHALQTRRLNVEATLQIAEWVRDSGGMLVFFSSDYVFDGVRAPYKETDPVCPLSEYGRQKAEVERELSRILPRHLIVRISGVFGWELARKNFVLQILDRAAASLPPLRAPTDMWYRPTYAPTLAPILAELIESDARGIYHAAGGMELSRYDFAREVIRVFGLDPGIVRPARCAELSRGAPRPSRSALESTRLPPQLQKHLWGAPAALRHMKEAEAGWKAYISEMGAAR